MNVFISGGCKNGKSFFAQRKAKEMAENCGKPLYYIATMIPYGEETRQKIERHRMMRAKKMFETEECYMDLSGFSDRCMKSMEEPTYVLLECMSNLTANEFYREDGAGDRTPEEILLGIDCLLAQTEHLIVVTNEVFSDGILYDDSTEQYKKMLGEINAGLAVRSDAFVEVVCSIPVILKGGPLC